MQRAAYSAMFGAMSQEWRMRSISNNLANVNTTGYKKDQLAFKDTFIQFAHDQMMEPVMNLRSEKLFPEPLHMARPRVALSLTNFEQGSLKQTDSPLDVALAGDGFLKIRTQQGDFLTRNGHFQMSADGTLVNERGEAVLGEGGEITLPSNGKVTINDSGQIFSNGDLVDTLQVVTVGNLAELEKLGHNLYRGRNGGPVQEVPSEATVNQGYLEASNINVVEEMVNMIETQRQFEAYTKAIKSAQELDTKVTGFGTVK
ncbi:MAG: flagellar basal-body rod protein FlgF [Desulfovibrionaceae bacterium]